MNNEELIKQGKVMIYDLCQALLKISEELSVLRDAIKGNTRATMSKYKQDQITRSPSIHKNQVNDMDPLPYPQDSEYPEAIIE